MTRHSTLTAILLGGVIAGTVDIFAPVLIYMISPIIVLHFIASGLIGHDAAVNGGLGTAGIGLLLQWAMSVIIAAIYAGVTNFLPIFRRLWIVGGLVAGVIIFFVMEYVVVPLSAVHKVPHFTPITFAENIAAMLLFGLIVAHFARNRG